MRGPLRGLCGGGLSSTGISGEVGASGSAARTAPVAGGPANGVTTAD
jgi:hypothetical protein